MSKKAHTISNNQANAEIISLLGRAVEFSSEKIIDLMRRLENGADDKGLNTLATYFNIILQKKDIFTKIKITYQEGCLHLTSKGNRQYIKLELICDKLVGHILYK